MNYVAKNRCEQTDVKLRPFEERLIYQNIRNKNLYTYCEQCAEGGCMVEVFSPNYSAFRATFEPGTL